MHPDIFTPGTYLIIVLLGLTTDVPLTVRHLKYSRTISTLRGGISFLLYRLQDNCLMFKTLFFAQYKGYDELKNPLLSSTRLLRSSLPS